MKELQKIRIESAKYDYSKLRGAITEHFGKCAVFAEFMGLSERSVSLKLNNIRGWTQEEMRKFCDLLGLEYTEIPKYFFVFVVQN